jgi:UDP-GlcNAc3NAcA epimerase
MRILTIIGARPQFIKSAVVSRRLASNKGLDEIVVHTGQHYDRNMSSIFFDELNITAPRLNLGIGGGTHGQNTGRMIEGIEKIIFDVKPNVVLVYGDTDSTLAGALAAAKTHTAVAHVEAGLRSFNRNMPEEINRVLTDHVSELLFSPTDTAARNLVREGVSESRICISGDVMYDAALYYADRAPTRQALFRKFGIPDEPFLLATVHRKENTDDRVRLLDIFCALSAAPIPVILPLHPRTKARLESYNINIRGSIKIIEPVGFLDMIGLLKNSVAVLTDSGGVQKEAYFHNKHCVTLRDETEWVELVEVGANLLVGADKERILDAIKHVTNMKITSTWPDLYGNGNAADIIVGRIANLG